MTEATEAAAAAPAASEPAPVPALIEPIAAEAPALDTPAVEPAAHADPVPERKPSTFPKEAIDQLTSLRARERQARQERDEVARQLQAARQMIEQVQRGQGQQQPNGQQTYQPQQPNQPSADDVTRMARYQVFLEKVDNLRSEGLRHYGNSFGDEVRTLAAVGADGDEFVDAVMSSAPGRGHELIHELAQDPNRAAAIAAMNPTQRIVELVKMSSKPAAPEAKTALAATVSKAPAPAPRIQPSTVADKPEGYWRTDKASDKEYTEGFNRMMAERAAKRGGR